jgi:putative salt-induced outer membrane protein
MRKTAFTTALLSMALMATPAAAQDTDGWTGEGSVSAGFTSGNTSTTDIGVALSGERRFGPWATSLQANVDFGKNNGVQSRNRWGVAGQLDRDLSERFFIYGRGSYERDKFSGFNSRLFIGTGAGYRILMGDMASWTIEGGPGYRRDEVQLTGIATNSLGARIGSAYAYQFNDAVSFSNDTEWVYSKVSSQLLNVAAITAQLSGALSARVSFEVRNESNPRPGRKATDTATRLSVVYGF